MTIFHINRSQITGGEEVHACLRTYTYLTCGSHECKSVILNLMINNFKAEPSKQVGVEFNEKSRGTIYEGL